MNAKCCDRCGAFYMPRKFDFKETNKSYLVEGRPIKSITIHVQGIENDVELCPECEKEFKDWFNKKDGRAVDNVILN